MIQKHWWRWLTSYFFWKPLINLCQLHKVMVSQFVIFWRPSRYVKDNFMPLCSLNISLYHKWIDLSRILWIAHMSEYTQDGWCIWTLLKTCKSCVALWMARRSSPNTYPRTQMAWKGNSQLHKICLTCT